MDGGWLIARRDDNQFNHPGGFICVKVEVEVEVEVKVAVAVAVGFGGELVCAFERHENKSVLVVRRLRRQIDRQTDCSCTTLLPKSFVFELISQECCWNRRRIVRYISPSLDLQPPYCFSHT